MLSSELLELGYEHFLDENGELDTLAISTWIHSKIGTLTEASGARKFNWWVNQHRNALEELERRLPCTVRVRENIKGGLFSRVSNMRRARWGLDEVDSYFQRVDHGVETEELISQTTLSDLITIFANSNRKFISRNGLSTEFIQTDPVDMLSIGVGLNYLAMNGHIPYYPRTAVDLGSGDGVPALMLHLMGIKHVVGIEKKTELHRTALSHIDNLNKYHRWNINAHNLTHINDTFHPDPYNNSEAVNNILAQSELVFTYPWPWQLDNILSTYRHLTPAHSMLLMYTQFQDEWHLYPEIINRYGLKQISIFGNTRKNPLHPYGQNVSLPSNFKTPSTDGQWGLFFKEEFAKEFID